MKTICEKKTLIPRFFIRTESGGPMTIRQGEALCNQYLADTLTEEILEHFEPLISPLLMEEIKENIQFKFALDLILIRNKINNTIRNKKHHENNL